MLSKPPNWIKSFSPSLIKRALDSADLQLLIKKAEKEYVFWEKFKRYPPLKDFTIEESWAYLKFSRMSTRENTAVRAKDKKNFTFTITKTMYQKLSFIDSNTSGFISSEWTRPTEIQKNQLIISGLSEEAIASSQIEGANTSRKVAKEMLLSKRKPRTRDEQMIINNYQVMQRLLDWKDLPLSLDIILDIQRNITTKTLENETDAGKLRTEEDNIAVVNSMTGETIFDPPTPVMVKEELKRLIEYANSDEDEEDFIHPVIKASILHFWLAYLHPFVDGNGRTARALFYWYLLRQNYWMFQYLSVSRVIKNAKDQYDNAYLYTETDDNDLTYFLMYKTKVIVQAIRDFTDHYKKKIEKDLSIEKLKIILKDFNERQVSLLEYASQHEDKTIDIQTHQSKYNTAYQTARTDILKLVEKGLLTQLSDGKKYEYVPNISAIKRLFNKKINILK